MRIVAFVSEYPRFHGAQRSFLHLLRSLPAAGVSPLVVVPGEGRVSEVYRAAGVEVRVLRGSGVLTEFGSGLLRRGVAAHARSMVADVLPYGRRLVDLMRDENAALLHCMTTRSTLAAGIVPRLEGFPVVGHMRGMLTPYSSAQRHLYAATATRIVSVAHGIVGDLPPWARSRCTVVHNAIDASAIVGADEGPALRTRLGLGPDDVAIAIVGSVSPEKGHHQLLDALARARPALAGLGRRIVVLVVGSASNAAYRRLLESKLPAIAPVEVRFVEWVSNPHAYHAASDFLVLPSVTRDLVATDEGPLAATSGEGLPRTILEAMFLGRPVVAYDMAGVTEQVVDGETGLVVPEGDVDALGRAIVAMSADPALRARMGEAGRTRCLAEFGTARMVDATVRIYREVTR